jgi:hypothetical protein
MDLENAGPISVAAVTVTLSAFVMRALVRGQRKKIEAVIEMLKTRGPLTLNEITEATGTNFVMKGYLMQALDRRVAEGGLTKIPPPPGHPRMRIFRDTKYGLPSAAVLPRITME